MAEADIQERMAFLQEDLKHLFDDQGIDQSAYDDKVNFQDPITRYSSVKGYVFNIKMLRLVFSPEFILHDLRQTADNEITTRWTMNMILAVNKYNPFRRWWDPQLVFTGTSIMTINRETGRFNQHIDTWDAIKNQQYLSWEAVRHLLSQLLTWSVPTSKAIKFTVLKKLSGYEVRRYEPFLVAQTSLVASQSATGPKTSHEGDACSSNSAVSGTARSSNAGRAQHEDSHRQSAYAALTAYAAGANGSRQQFAVGVPIMSNREDKLQVVLEGATQDAALMPAPNNEQVQCVTFPGGIYAVRGFKGPVSEQQTAAEVQKLQQLVSRDALPVDGSGHILAQYHGGSKSPRANYNEVLQRLETFDVWGQKEI